MTDPNLEYAKQLDAERRGEAPPEPSKQHWYEGGDEPETGEDYRREYEHWEDEDRAAHRSRRSSVDPELQRLEALEPLKAPWWKFSHKPPYSKLLRDYQRAKVLGSISNPRVAELVEAAYKLANKHNVVVRWIRGGKDYLKQSQAATHDAQAYRHWVHQQLAASDLARLLPGGRESLPDIYEAMGEPWRSIERLFEPKNYKQLLTHVVRHLDWYLDPTQRPKPPIWQISLGVAIVVFLGLVGTLWHFGVRIQGGYMWTYLIKAMAVGFAALGSRFFGKQKVGDKVLTNFYRSRGLINSAELYYYLADTYAEVEDEFEDSTSNPGFA